MIRARSLVENRVLAHPDDVPEVDQLIFWTFKATQSPKQISFKGGVRSRIWYRRIKKKGLSLTVERSWCTGHTKGSLLLGSHPL
jgi:hypothetical protein